MDKIGDRVTSVRHFAHTVAFLAALAGSGCAMHAPVLQSYRLMRMPPNEVLAPPGVADPELALRTFRSAVMAGRGTCPPVSGGVAIQKRGSHLRVSVSKDELLKQPSGWLFERAAELESAGCVAAGDGEKLAQEIASSLPLAPTQAVRLLYSNQLEILPQMTIQIVSPILKDPKGPVLEDVQATGNDRTINLAVRSSDNLLGVEIATYSVAATANGGVRVTPVSAERRKGSEVEHATQPATNYFDFPADAAFFRVFYEATQTDYAAIVVGARTRVDLEKRTRLLEAGAASCAALNHELCREVPKQVAINGMISVTVNGSPMQVTWGTNVGGVMRAAGRSSTPGLTVMKSFNGKLVPLEFDPGSTGILAVQMTGGEVLSWK